MIEIFSLSFYSEGVWQFEKLGRFFSTNYYLKTLWFTFWQAAVSTILTLVVALPGAYIFARYRFPGKTLLQAFATVPFVLPTVVVAAAFRSFLGANGVLNSWLVTIFGLKSPPFEMNYSIWFILLAHVFYNYTIVLRIVGGFWAGIQSNLTEAAAMLGASPGRAFFRITLPLLAPAILTASLLVFIFCFSSFGVILILGGPRFATIEVEIYRQAVHLFNLPMAAALSIIQILFTFILMWAYTSLQKKRSVSFNPESADYARKPVRGAGPAILVTLNTLLLVVLIGAPLGSLIFSSFNTETGFSLLYYKALFENPVRSVFYVPPVKAIFYSTGFAAITLVLALILGLLASIYLTGERSRGGSILDPIFMLPLSTSAVTLGFGFIIALDEPPLNLRTSLMLVPLAHTLVAFPFVVRSILPALRSIPKSLKESASVLGASPFKVIRLIDLPIIGKAMLVGAVFAFTVSLGEFGASVFVARPQTPTMPLAIYRALGQPGAINYGQAMAMSSLLMMVTAVGFLSLERFRFKGIGEF